MASDLVREQLQAALGSAYTLDRELGGGGMSRVFVATETALSRRVVVKVLSPELAQGLSAERFSREIKLAATLQDPHIVPVLNTGVADGMPWFTMPYVEGESLRARLMRGSISYTESVSILRDVALALEAAHAHGVVHRDIKPDNVLLSGRTAVVADFGIAKAVSAARTEGAAASGATLTSVGTSLGTPAYMAPEQATGDATDHRADIYAWGVMAYELLAARHPFADKSTTQQLIAAQIAERPSPLMAVKPAIAPPLSAFVMRCLEKEPSARPANAAEIIEALDGMVTPGASSARAAIAPTPNRRKIVIAAAVLLVVALGAVAVFSSKRNNASDSTLAVANGHRIAVLPFENLGDSADAYFVDGMTDAVRSKLTGLAELEVIARGSSKAYARTTKSPKEIAGELGVRYLLTGTVRFAKRAGSEHRVQVSPALVEVGTDGSAANRWEQPFDADLSDVFKVQGEIAGKVASAMQVALGGAARATLATPLTSNPAAYDAYLRAEAAWDGSARTDAVSLRKAIASFQQAVLLDSGFVAAWSALSRANSLLYTNAGTPDLAAKAQAISAAERASALDPDGVLGLFATAGYQRLGADDLLEATRLIDRALKVEPNNIAVLSEAGLLMGESGRLAEGLKLFESASRLDPRSARLWFAMGRLATRAGDLTLARRTIDRARSLAPAAANIASGRIAVELAAGDLNAARVVLASAAVDVGRERIISYLSSFWDLGWMLDSANTELVLSLPATSFDGEAATQRMVRAQLYAWRGDSLRARQWGDSAARSQDSIVRASPRDPQQTVLLGLALSLAGRPADALKSTRRGLELAAATGRGSEFSVVAGYYHFVAARTAVLAGDYAQAFTWLAESRRRHYYASAAWIRMEPSFKPLRNDPRFEQVLAVKY